MSKFSNAVVQIKGWELFWTKVKAVNYSRVSVKKIFELYC